MPGNNNGNKLPNEFNLLEGKSQMELVVPAIIIQIMKIIKKK